MATHGTDDRPPVTMVVIGAGARGKTYARYAIEEPDKLRVVAVAEPRRFHREVVAYRKRSMIREAHKLLERFADCALISTPDSEHVEPAVALADLGYHILLEKPMAVTAEDCRRIVRATQQNQVMLAVCHVLRYTPYMRKMKELIDNGAVGEVVNIQHLEPIGWWHFAHSYVRGAWRNEAQSTFMLMAKCCHDLDVIRYLADSACTQVSSFGSLMHFRRDKKPPGSGSRCIDCAVERDCPYSAKKAYLERAMHNHFGWPVSSLLDDEPSLEAVQDALANGPYGKCVWDCDNDVTDHQVVSLQFESGASATLTSTAFTEAVCQRRTRIFGSMGELEGDGENTIRHFDFTTQRVTFHEADGAPPRTAIRGHGGADYFLIRDFVEAVRSGDRSLIQTGADETLESHLIVFAAEAARLAQTVVHLPDVWHQGLPSAVLRASGLLRDASNPRMDETTGRAISHGSQATPLMASGGGGASSSPAAMTITTAAPPLDTPIGGREAMAHIAWLERGSNHQRPVGDSWVPLPTAPVTAPSTTIAGNTGGPAGGGSAAGGGPPAGGWHGEKRAVDDGEEEEDDEDRDRERFHGDGGTMSRPRGMAPAEDDELAGGMPHHHHQQQEEERERGRSDGQGTASSSQGWPSPWYTGAGATPSDREGPGMFHLSGSSDGRSVSASDTDTRRYCGEKVYMTRGRSLMEGKRDW